ncbi:type II toxin-antitoxin system RelE/ParE family toxin [Sphingobium sp. BYY-5]|uniref:type II toxin-antitoxin system RelE/ParE family toxin n=1 Tax=Sphingobium sp. BYY-5 TaxID=2926400 RepID=UPI001FA80DB2|nr:type II toxin-antitoxin system RelE/ParE family toxin [Sphingobium sp. BYY-5]
MTATIRFNAAAERDLAEIATYTQQRWGPEQAKSYLIGIADTIDRIAIHPGIGSPINDVRGGYRKLRFESHHIYYRSDKTAVEIVRILHQRADHIPQLQ